MSIPSGKGHIDLSFVIVHHTQSAHSLPHLDLLCHICWNWLFSVLINFFLGGNREEINRLDGKSTAAVDVGL